MKNLLFLLLLFTSSFLPAQSSNFSSLLEANLSYISANPTDTDWLKLSKAFQTLSKENADEWLGHYYTAFTFMKLAGTYEDQTLPIVASNLDKAQSAIEEAIKLAPNDSEVLVLQGFIYIARIWESPFLNGGLYGRKVSKISKQAIEINPENPRAYYLKGLLTFHTPRFVGGGKDKAKPWLQKAKEKFDAFNFESAILPYWGATENAILLEDCDASSSNTGSK